MSWAKVCHHCLSSLRVRILIPGQMSQFHWHVVDSHSFPLQVPGFQEVAEKGAYSTSMVYTPEDVQDIVSYAAEVCLVSVCYGLHSSSPLPARNRCFNRRLSLRISRYVAHMGLNFVIGY